MEDALEQLRSIVATRTRRLVVWCGAGLSVPAGIPTWSVLQRRLEARLEEKLRSLDMADQQKEAKVRGIRQEPNPWIAFHRLQNELGITTYREAIRASLAKAVTADLPPAYIAIWMLRPAGVINLNLDRLATRAFAEAKQNGLIEFKGKEMRSYTHTLNNPRPFLCNLHGIEEDVESWVFTHAELKNWQKMQPMAYIYPLFSLHRRFFFSASLLMMLRLVVILSVWQVISYIRSRIFG